MMRNRVSENKSFSLVLLFVTLIAALPGRLGARVKYDAQIPQVAFGAQELEAALKEAGREDLQVTLVVQADEASPESFKIK